MRESAGLTMEDRETEEKYDKEMSETINVYRISDETHDAINDNEDMEQVVRLCSEIKDMTVNKLKMNIKLPMPSQYDGKTPQFNEWAGEVKAYLMVHNIYIEDLMEESTRSQV
eukprot:4090113-Amphidinium_carterae.1